MQKTQAAKTPTIKNISPPDLPRPLTRAIELLESRGFETRLCGGAVRDILLGRSVFDYDLATQANPQELLKIFTEKPFRGLPTGLDHGTVTVVYNRRVVGEFTTLRRDKNPDGRHASVEFGGISFEEDALRRDFTVNALFLDTKGCITDYVCGLDDLQSSTLRFVGDPVARIEEDYLRALRFFRFAAQISFKTLCPRALTAIASVPAEKIGKLSKERIYQEWRKTLTGSSIASALSQYEQTGLLAKVFPGLKLGPIEQIQKALLSPIQANAESNEDFTISDQTQFEQRVQLSRFAIACMTYAQNPNHWREWLKPPGDLMECIEEAELWALQSNDLTDERMLALIDPLERRGTVDLKTISDIMMPFKPHLITRTQEFEHRTRDLRHSPLAIRPDELAQILGRKTGEWLGRCLKHLRVKIVVENESNSRENLIKLARAFCDQER